MFEKSLEKENHNLRSTVLRGRNFISTLIVALLFIAGQSHYSFAVIINGNGNGNGYNVNGFNGTGIPIILKSIAILPLENLTDDRNATDIVTEHVKRELKGKGWVLITKAETVEEFLAKKRIRYTGSITRMTVREMGKVLGVDAVLVGSVTQFSGNKTTATVGVSARLVSALDGSLIWADNKAYTTRDFVGLLGLGAVSSLDEISSIVVKDLVKSIADRFFINEAALSPFEIERVAAYPAVGKGGEEIELRVKVLPILEEPKEVKAVIDGKEVAFSIMGDGEFVGSVIAPEAEGIYFVDVVAMNHSGVPFSFDAAGKIVVDNTPPKISMALDKKIFASNSRNNSVIFTTMLLSLEEIDEWRMEILDKKGKLVRGDRGYGKVPKKLIWRGETDKRGRAGDGEYTCKFSVKDVAGNETVIIEKVKVKNSPPDIKVDVDIIDDILLFTFNHDPDDNIQSWELLLKDRKGKIVNQFEGEGDIPEKLEYLMEEDFDFRKTTFSITALDVAGNSFKLTKALPSFFTGKIPFARLKEKGLFVEDF
jgi:TolB-like protein